VESPPVNRSTPYLSVVVTTCRDDASGDNSDAHAELQRFVSDFDKRCRHARLDAEVIVVEWNVPPDRERAAARLDLAEPSWCTHRFIDVPPSVHHGFRHADVLPAFPMIAKNAGIRRARGRFVLSTSTGVIFPSELIAELASQSLQPRRLYRVDRHDVEPDVPRDLSPEMLSRHCVANQHQIHTRSGSYPTRPDGSPARPENDIVDGRSVQLGAGWHVLEGQKQTGFFRWAGSRADLIVETVGKAARTLVIDIEANPYDPRAWLTLEAVLGDRVLSRTHVTGRMRVKVPLARAEMSAARRIELHVKAGHAKPRFRLPLFERREDLLYRVYSAETREPAADDSMFEYPLSGWTTADPKSAQTVAPSADGLVVETSSGKWLYSMHHEIRARSSGTYRFELVCSVLDGRLLVGVLNGLRSAWMPASVTVQPEGTRLRFSISVDLGRGDSCWLTISNDHPDGIGVSRFIINEMTGSVDPARVVGSGAPATFAGRLIVKASAAAARIVAPLRRTASAASSRTLSRTRMSGLADAIVRVLVRAIPARVRARIVRASPEYRSVETAFRKADDEARLLAPLRDLSPLESLLRRHRPENIHVNACGDFQLMARDDWHELRGFPEIEGFSDHIDSLLSFIADAAGIKEETLATPVYHVQPRDRGAEAAGEDELMRRRSAQRDVPRLEAGTVSIWAAQMRWLQRPMMVNHSDWGLGSVELQEHTIPATIGSAP